MSLQKLIVLTDFTQASTLALEHALQLSSAASASVVTVHLVDQDSDLEWSDKKCLAQLKQARNYEASIPIEVVSRNSNLFSELQPLIREFRADMTFMATHGKKDIQFLRGSDALKVLTGMEAPTIIVQKASPLQAYARIALPLFPDSQAPPREAFFDLAQISKSEVDLFLPLAKDEYEALFLQQQLNHIVQTLDRLGIKNAQVDLEITSDKMTKAMQTLLEGGGYELLAISLPGELRQLKNRNQRSFVQSMITNKQQVPVLFL